MGPTIGGMRWVTWLAVNVIALAAALWLLDGLAIDYEHPPTRMKKILAIVVIGAVMGLINKFVRPIVTILSLPAIILSLGLALLLVNAAMLGLTALVTRHFGHDLGFHLHVAGFWTAVVGGLIITIASWAASMVLDSLTD